MENKNERYLTFKKNAGEFLRRNGFNLVLALCVMIIGIAAVATLMPGQPPEAASTPTPAATPPVQAASMSGDERLPNTASTPTPMVTPESTPNATPAPAQTAKPAMAQAPKAEAPLTGDIIWGYAADELIYSVTLEQWTTHPGVDIAAKPGAEVRCVLGGEVAKVYEDDALGMTVLVEHSGDRSSLYANLNTDVPVKKGQKVEAAHVIGTVGDTSVSECMLESHLHFGFFVKGNPVNPKEYVLLGK